jgi:guanylate kinase
MGIFLITAPSGAGKTTMVKELQSQGIWEECISHTTRPMRDGEINGDTYHFVEEDDFVEAYQAGEFAEKVEYDGNYYGITHEEINRVIKNGKHVAIIVEYEGYKQIKELYPEAIGIFLYMSKEDCMANMLLRGDSLEKATSRINKYEDEMKNRNEYDYVVKNVRNKREYTSSIIKSILFQYQEGMSIYSGIGNSRTLHIDNNNG